MFRLLFRRRNRREIFEMKFNRALVEGNLPCYSCHKTIIVFESKFIAECLLTLKAVTGFFDSSFIPIDAKNCTFRIFSTIENKSDKKSGGLLIKLLRFNVPCSNGGFLQFNQNITICGKLEELPENRRTFYYKSFANSNWSVYNHPKVNFAYKLVDHCYNITFLDYNSSFTIEPTKLALRCHFKIHLPFGNDIQLKLRLNGNIFDSKLVGEQIVFGSEIKLDEGRFNYSNLNLDDFSLSSDFTIPNESFGCDGILIEIINRMKEKWNQCISQADRKKNFAYTLRSADNVLFIRVVQKNYASNRTKVSQLYSTKTISNDYRIDESSFGPMISLEYSAVPIENIASQCAFGWILVEEFCLSTFSELLTWQNAESYCNDLGGHLASIHSESEHQKIDKMLMNR